MHLRNVYIYAIHVFCKEKERDTNSCHKLCINHQNLSILKTLCMGGCWEGIALKLGWVDNILTSILLAGKVSIPFKETFNRIRWKTIQLTVLQFCFFLFLSNTITTVTFIQFVEYVWIRCCLAMPTQLFFMLQGEVWWMALGWKIITRSIVCSSHFTNRTLKDVQVNLT